MRNVIGIRRENVDLSERRSPLTPEQVALVITNLGIRVLVAPSERRVFPDSEFAAAGAELTDDLSPCNVIFGVKEVPIEDIGPHHAYCYFSHTIKAQRYNMGMLSHLIENNNTLLDYELVTNENGKRLIFFGDFAGFAGMIDSLWALGQRLDIENVLNPFSAMRPAHEYESLEAAEAAIRLVGEQIRLEGLPSAITPFICVFTGRGRVSKSAQKMFRHLPAVEILPDDIPGMSAASYSNHAVYFAEFNRQDLYRRIDGADYDADTFAANPGAFAGQMHHYVPHITMLINGIYWSPRYPRLITRDHLKELKRDSIDCPLRIIGDITCDIEGSIEFTTKATTSENPVFVYDVELDAVRDGFVGDGPVVLAIDRLPAELPRESSQSFGDGLMPFIRALASADFTYPFTELDLPAPLRRAVIVHRGQLTTNFQYLNEHLLGAE